MTEPKLPELPEERRYGPESDGPLDEVNLAHPTCDVIVYGERCYAAGVAAERERSPMVLVNGILQTQPDSDVPMMLAVNTSPKAMSYVDDWGPAHVRRVQIPPGEFVWVRRRKGETP